MTDRERKQLDQVEPLPFSEEEQRRVIAHIRRQKQTKKTSSLVKGLLAVALFFMTIVSASILSPTIASTIPFMEDIVALFIKEEPTEKEVHERNKELSTPLHLKQQYGEVTIEVERAVYDGAFLVAYLSVETEKPSDKPYVNLHGNPLQWNGQAFTGTSRQTSYRVSPHKTIVELRTQADFVEASPETLHIFWNVEGITFYEHDLGEHETTFEGDWAFQFEVEKQPTTRIEVEQTIERKEYTFTLHSIEQSPITTTLHYEVEGVSEEVLEGFILSVRDDNGWNYYASYTTGEKENNRYKARAYYEVIPLDTRALTIEILLPNQQEADTFTFTY